MSHVEYLSSQIEKLSWHEKQELTKRLLEKMNSEEIEELMEKIKDNKELTGILKLIEPVFEDWDNEEDQVYDNLYLKS